MSDPKLVDLKGQALHETDSGIKIQFDSAPGERGFKIVWLPKSQVEDNDDGTFTMPEWLAKEKGLI